MVLQALHANLKLQVNRRPVNSKQLHVTIRRLQFSASVMSLQSSRSVIYVVTAMSLGCVYDSSMTLHQCIRDHEPLNWQSVIIRETLLKMRTLGLTMLLYAIGN